MAVSRRLRFEILRRDNYTCYYCGRKPPEVELTIDHVLPQALGGDDSAGNLVACCKECNSGKTSIAPGSPLLAQVDTDALRWSAALKAASEKASADHVAVQQYRNDFYDAWHDYRFPGALEENWRSSIENFRTRGLPIEVLIEAVHKAAGTSYIKTSDKFKYACGIAWKRVREIENNARASLAANTERPAEQVEAPAQGQWVDPAAAVVVEATVAVWLSMWRAANGEEPSAGLENKVREYAIELYPEEFSASVLIAAAQEAASRKSADLYAYSDDDSPEALHREVARWFFFGWALGARERNESSRPTTADWAAIDASARQARAAGYGTSTIAESVFRAATAGQTSLAAYLIRYEDAEELAEDSVSWFRRPDCSQDELDENAAAAEVEAAEALQRRASQRANGPSPWGNSDEVPF